MTVLDVVVIGAGIVGIAVAQALSRASGVRVTVLERDVGAPRGSTTYAPGFIGLYNEVPILTALAQESAAIYEEVGTRLRRSGGLEIATTDTAAASLCRRVADTRAAGRPAEVLDFSDLPGSVTSFVDGDPVVAAAHFAADGSVDVPELSREIRDRALATGARFRYGQEVVGIESRAGGVAVRTVAGSLFAGDAAVLAVGVWGPALAQLVGLHLPVFPVAHPYVYDVSRPTRIPGPFVRWPEHHVYSRVHGDRLGIGSYDHVPVSVSQDDLREGAGLEWSDEFTPVIESAQRLLRAEATFTPQRYVNGVFAMTPDNLPFLGRHPDAPKIWIAGALWVTHAAGAADRLAAAMLTDGELPQELGVSRFSGANHARLHERALRLYRDIYANDVARSPRAVCGYDLTSPEAGSSS